METTISFRCSSCNQALKVGADKAGRKVRCVKCKSIMVIPADTKLLPEPETASAPHEPAQDEANIETRDEPEPEVPRRRVVQVEEPASDEVRVVSRGKKKPKPAEAETEEEPPPKVRRKRKRKAEHEEEDEGGDRKRSKRKKTPWEIVYVGVTLLTVPAGLGVLFALSGIVFMLLPASAIVSMGGWFNSWMLWVPFGSSTIASLVGYGLCLYTPPLHNVRPLAATVLVTSLLISALSFAPYLHSPTDNQPASAEQAADMFDLFRWWMIAFLLLTDTLIVVQPFFLRALARNARAEGTAENCFNLLKLSAGNVAIGLIDILVFQIALRFEAMTFLVHAIKPLIWITLLLGLGYAVFHLLLLVEIRLAVGDMRSKRSG
jgi:hypothetical protein